MIKRFGRMIVVYLLAILSRGIIHKYKPIIIMVTGSVGKTSTKDAIAAALSGSFFLRKSKKSYNSEFGVPLTIIGSKNPWNNPLAWIKVFQEALTLLILPNHYPKLLVLEVGADRPGDLMRILRIATPDVTVVTLLPDVPVHVEAYSTPQAVRDEEFAPAYALSQSGSLIVSADDMYARIMSERLSVNVTTYGISDEANVRISKIKTYLQNEIVKGMQAEVTINGKVKDLVVCGSVGRQQLAPAAAALAVASSLGIRVSSALNGLKDYTPPPGRGRVLSGKNESIIIDDSYNASPAAVEEALATLTTLTASNRRIAVLGDMLELGRFSVEEHVRVGVLAAKAANILVVVGVRARKIADAALESGMKKDNVFIFNNSKDAIQKLNDLIEKGDLVLVKGSQSVRTEIIVEALLFDPMDSDKLVRQEKEWKNKS